jgi:excinuclease ABC subunit A
MGLGYLTLGEATPTLSGGEAQRLKLSKHINKKQLKTLFLFDEPTIGLHPKDVSKLIEIFDKLIENGATLVVIEHDRDLIRNADYIIDIGFDRIKQEGKIIKSGTLNDIMSCDESITGKYL